MGVGESDTVGEGLATVTDADADADADGDGSAPVGAHADRARTHTAVAASAATGIFIGTAWHACGCGGYWGNRVLCATFTAPDALGDA